MEQETVRRLEVSLLATVNRGLCRAEVNQEGHLILTLSDGTAMDAGMVRGQEGTVPPSLTQAVEALQEQLETLRAQGAMTQEQKAKLDSALQRSGGLMTGDLRMAADRHIRWGSGNAGLSSDGSNTILQADTGSSAIVLENEISEEATDIYVTASGVDFGGAVLRYVAYPQDSEDAATKEYVDDAIDEAMGDLSAALEELADLAEEVSA